MKPKVSRLELINEYEHAPRSALFAQETVAAILDCSLATIERDRWAGSGIPFVKIGRLVRYRKEDILSWIETHQTFKSTSENKSEEKKSFDAKWLEYQADLELFKAGKEALKNAMLNTKKQELKSKSVEHTFDSDSLRQQLISLSEPKKPIWKRYKTNDATIEKLSELLVENPRGLLLFRDELVGLLSSWEQQGRESDRAFFLEAWNGYGSLTTDRIGRGTVHK